MDEQEREKLRRELTEICLSFQPPKEGKHEFEDITQRFDRYQMEQAERLTYQQQGALEYSEAQTPHQDAVDRQRTEQSIRTYFDDKQNFIDRQIRNAYRATCKANKYSVIEEQEEGQGDEEGKKKQPEKLTLELRPPAEMRQGEPVVFLTPDTKPADMSEKKGRTVDDDSPKKPPASTPLPDWAQNNPKRNGPSL